MDQLNEHRRNQNVINRIIL